MFRGLRASAVVALLALAGACGGDDEAAEPEAGERLGTAEMAGEGDSPAFALLRGEDTLLVERYTLNGSRVSGTMRDPTGGSVEYQTIHSTDGGDRSMQLTIRDGNPEVQPVVSTFTLRGDSAFLEMARGDSTVRQSDAVPARALPFMSPSMGNMALLVQSARSLVGDSGQVTIMAASIGQAPVVVSPLIVWHADTAWVRGDQMNQFKLVFSGGDLVSVENAPAQMRAIRLPSN